MTSDENGQQKTKNNIAIAILRMPDGKEHEIPLPAKTFKSGREGYYAHLPSFDMKTRYMADKYKYGKRAMETSNKHGK